MLSGLQQVTSYREMGMAVALGGVAAVVEFGLGLPAYSLLAVVAVLVIVVAYVDLRTDITIPLIGTN